MLWQTLYIGWIVVEILIAVLTRTKRGSGDVQDRGTMPLLWITIALAMTAAGFARYYFATIVPFHVPTLATALILLGLFIRITAVLSLGKAFSANVAIRESQSLNQSGFYRFVRHPSYLGLEIIFVAVGLHQGNSIAFACAVVPCTIALLYRIQLEEKILVAAFGTQYEQYMLRTKRLLPFIY